MAFGNFEGKDLSYADLRKQFDRDNVLQTDWYKKRLLLKQTKDSVFMEKQIAYLTDFMAHANNEILAAEMQIAKRIEKAKNELKFIESEKYIQNLVGTIGADPLFKWK